MSDGSIEVAGPADGHEDVLAPGALELVAGLQREFGEERVARLEARRERQERFDQGERLDFLNSTGSVRGGDWAIGSVPPDLQDRRVEITGPTDAKMLINGLNSGARCYMADLEDANTPSWENMVGGQANLSAAVRGELRFENPDGRVYELADETATLIVRPRGWHLDEPHVLVDEKPVAGAFFDFGMHVFHNAQALLERGSGPYFYLPKMESHREARLWNDVLTYAERLLGLSDGTIKATVLIETIPAAFEMDEILYELRERVVGLNAGRWDYIFSMIKCFREWPEFVLPDRNDVQMTVPFMKAYTELLVKTCHRRGAHAMGGMSALIPTASDLEASERAVGGVRDDKQREADQGFDGTWVAHPALVAVAREQFDGVLGDRPNQVDRQRDDVGVGAEQLLDAEATPGLITEEGLRSNISVGIRYIESWLGGRGAAAINNLMEDVATAEIARSQIWQWIRHGARLDGDGARVKRDLVATLIDEEVLRLDADGQGGAHRAAATEIFSELALGDDLAEFLTYSASEWLEQ